MNAVAIPGLMPVDSLSLLIGDRRRRIMVEAVLPADHPVRLQLALNDWLARTWRHWQ